MQIKEIESLARDKVDNLLITIPFYREVKGGVEPWQYDELLRHSRIVNFEPGEVVMSRGDVDTWMYFVLKGQLVVYPGDTKDDNEPVNYITPGEVFGDLAMLVDGKRMATVVADDNSREVAVFGTDFSIFGELDDTSVLSLNTKLVFYRSMVHGIRWKLEMYKMEHPTHPLVDRLRKIPIYTGLKGGKEELTSLHGQAKDLASILTEWNQEFGGPADMVKSTASEDFNPALVKELE